MKRFLISLFLALSMTSCYAQPVVVRAGVYYSPVDVELVDSQYWMYRGPDVYFDFRDCYHCYYHGGAWYYPNHRVYVPGHGVHHDYRHDHYDHAHHR